MVRPLLLAWAVPVFWGFAFSSEAQAQEPKPDTIYSKLVRSVARVQTPSGSGTAWVYDAERRLLVTNYHVVADNRTRSKTANQQFISFDEVELVFPQFTPDGRSVGEKTEYAKVKVVTARVIDSDSRRDLALLQADELPPGTREIPLAAALPEPGDAIHSVGNPGVSSFFWVYSKGYVRQMGHGVSQIGKDVTYYCATHVIETQSPTNPGDSGSPMANDRGELVGVHHAGSKTVGALTNSAIGLPTFKQYAADVAPLIEPRTAGEFANRANHYLARDRFALAEVDFRRAIAEFERLPLRMDVNFLFSNWQHCQAMLASTLANQFKYDAAKRTIDKLIEKEPKYAFAFAMRAQIRWQRSLTPIDLLLGISNVTADNEAILALQRNRSFWYPSLPREGIQ